MNLPKTKSPSKRNRDKQRSENHRIKVSLDECAKMKTELDKILFSGFEFTFSDGLGKQEVTKTFELGMMIKADETLEQIKFQHAENHASKIFQQRLDLGYIDENEEEFEDEKMDNDEIDHDLDSSNCFEISRSIPDNNKILEPRVINEVTPFDFDIIENKMHVPDLKFRIEEVLFVTNCKVCFLSPKHCICTLPYAGDYIVPPLVNENDEYKDCVLKLQTQLCDCDDTPIEYDDNNYAILLSDNFLINYKHIKLRYSDTKYCVLELMKPKRYFSRREKIKYTRVFQSGSHFTLLTQAILGISDNDHRLKVLPPGLAPCKEYFHYLTKKTQLPPGKFRCTYVRKHLCYEQMIEQYSTITVIRYLQMISIGMISIIGDPMRLPGFY